MVMITDDIFTFPNMLLTLPFIVSFCFFIAINSLVLQTTRKHFRKKKTAAHLEVS